MLHWKDTLWEFDYPAQLTASLSFAQVSILFLSFDWKKEANTRYTEKWVYTNVEDDKHNNIIYLSLSENKISIPSGLVNIIDSILGI